jgi:hypothetical protein
MPRRSLPHLLVLLLCATAWGTGPACAAGVGTPTPPPAAQGTTLGPSPTLTARLSPEQRSALEKATYVYISSTRKDGTPSKEAEIWFMLYDDSIWVGSAPTSWRVKRIRWHRPDATIHIGTPDGPSLRARGELVTDEKLYDKLCDTFAVKYSSRWPRWDKSFREGLRSGERVLVRYTPLPAS